jgi:hypothetical protein
MRIYDDIQLEKRKRWVPLSSKENEVTVPRWENILSKLKKQDEDELVSK